MTKDLLCQELRDACWDSSKSLTSPLSTVAAIKHFYHRGRTATVKERDVVREF